MDAKAKTQLSDIMTGGFNPHKKQLEEARKLVTKWKATGLLEGMDGETQTSGMAVLLENQARQLIDEASATSPSGQSSEEWSGVALPLVRRIFGEIAAKDFVSVQPMNLPSGLVFFLDFKYGGVAGGAGHFGEAAGANIHGTTDTKDTDASGGLYGVGRFGYTHSTGSQLLTVANTGSWGTVPATPNQLNFDTTSSALYKYEVIGLDSDVDTNAIRVIEVAGDAGAFVNEYSTFDGTTATFFGASGLAVASTLNYVVSNPTDYTRGDFEQSKTGLNANPETDIGIPEIDVEMRSEPIIAKTRKLKAVWTPELAQDLNAYHSVDAEAELTSMLSEYISMEIDLEILDMLIANASTTEYWSAKIGQEYNSSTGLFAAGANVEGYAYTKNDWFSTLGNKLQRVSNKIHQKTMRGGANFLVCGPDVATVIESIPGYNVNTDGTNSQFAMGVEQVGTLKNRWNVYKNPYMTENIVLIGFRGSNFLETGAVYAPYIPLIMTPLVYDPKNFQPRKGVMTRYAKKMVRPEFYGKIVIADPEAI